MSRITVSLDLLRWARERARLGIDDLVGRFPKLADWESGTECRVLHCFQKKTQKTSSSDLKLAKGRYRDLTRELNR